MAELAAALRNTLGLTKLTDGVYTLRHGNIQATLLLTERLLEAVEPSALEQLLKAMELPGLEQVIITPDVHTGYAVPIGFAGVSSTHLYPDTVGPDPACSVSLSRIPFKGFEALDKPARRAIINDLEAAVSVTRRRHRGRTRVQRPPITFDELMDILTGRYRFPKTWVASHKPLHETAEPKRLGELTEILRALTTKTMLQQIGSIGGGNHFLEVQIGEDGNLYVMAHFGSRGLGAAGAAYFFEHIREELGAKRPVTEHELLYVRTDEPLGQLYYMFQQAMLEYATFNHVKVQEAATAVIRRHLAVEEPAEFLGHIPHNFIELKGGRYWQRKGATPAYDNDGIPLLIPGSMATTSYVLAPGPNAARYGESVPHGAGRVLSRSAARSQLDQLAMDKDFDARGVMGSFRHVPLDESSGAYKDVDEVIQAVVTPGVAVVVNRLRPVLVLKGE